MSEVTTALAEINVIARAAGGELIIEGPEEPGDTDTVEDLTSEEQQIALNHCVLKTDRPRKKIGRIG